MLYRNYGKNNQKLSVIGLGGISVKGLGEKKATEIINYSIDKGVNYFDVAPTYGDAQELFGSGLRGHRNKIFLACKTKFRSSKESIHDLENSLRILKTDYFDLYQLHGMKSKNDYEKAMGKNGVIETLDQAKKDGKIKHVGFSCHSTEIAELLIENYDFDSVLLPINWNLLLKQGFAKDTIHKITKKGINLLALKVMAHRLWKNKEERENSYKNCWYKPLDDQKEINLAVNFALSQKITSFLPPGDHSLFLKGIEAVENYKKTDQRKINQLINLDNNNLPLGSNKEIYI
ncbi:MAG: oxidoreductase [Chloroflexi bacterium]|nr:oxidoreductase [Chloroflexota bacterium]